jgi:hypothetical protein
MTTIKATCGDCRQHVDLAPADVIVLHNALQAIWPHCGNVQATRIRPEHRLALAVIGCEAFDGAELEAVLR